MPADIEANLLARYYDGIAEVYEEQVYGKLQRYGERVRRFLREAAPGPGARVLDVGCGPGNLTRDLPEGVEVVGIDLSSEMLRVAQRGRPTGTYRVHDYHQQLPVDLGTFHVVLAVSCLEFCHDLEAVIVNLAGAARPGARVLLAVVERHADGGEEQASVPISPKLPGVNMYRYTREQVLVVVQGLGLRILEHQRNPGWMRGEELVEYRVWDLMVPLTRVRPPQPSRTATDARTRTTMCHCANAPDAISLKETSDALMDSLALTDESKEHWARLYRCGHCGQHWRVDVVAPQDRVARVAVKLPSVEHWAEFDDSAALRDLIVREHGGLSDLPCAWAGCEQLAVNGKAVCVFHMRR